MGSHWALLKYLVILRVYIQLTRTSSTLRIPWTSGGMKISSSVASGALRVLAVRRALSGPPEVFLVTKSLLGGPWVLWSLAGAGGVSGVFFCPQGTLGWGPCAEWKAPLDSVGALLAFESLARLACSGLLSSFFCFTNSEFISAMLLHFRRCHQILPSPVLVVSILCYQETCQVPDSRVLSFSKQPPILIFSILCVGV